jgi:hypothetical protein
VLLLKVIFTFRPFKTQAMAICSRKCSRRQCNLTEYKTSYYQECPNEAAEAIAIVGKDERTGVRGVTVLNKSSNVGAETTTVRPVSGSHPFTPVNREVSSIDVGLPQVPGQKLPQKSKRVTVLLRHG